MWFESKPSEEMLKMKPNRKIQGKSQGPKEAQNAAFEKRRDRTKKEPPRAARGGGRTAVLPGTHGRASPLPPIFGFSVRLFDFLHNFSVFADALPLKGACT